MDKKVVCTITMPLWRVSGVHWVEAGCAIIEVYEGETVEEAKARWHKERNDRIAREEEERRLAIQKEAQEQLEWLESFNPNHLPVPKPISLDDEQVIL